MPSTITKCAYLQIPLEDVLEATNNFHDDNIIGHERFGTAYKGRLSRSGRLMEIVARSQTLTWTQRLKICVGVARALSYLHHSEGRDYSIIHCNINSDTILLDESWESKLSGFDFFIKQSVKYKDQVCLFEHTLRMGCMDPVIEKTGGVTHKSDIYSFGVVLFELLCGRRAFIQKEVDLSLAPLAECHYENGTLQDIILPDLYCNQILSPQSLLKYSSVAYSCLSEGRAY
ncbi:putative protein kinase RLK-Pelle-CrRLK1L-1 family [Helianthus anomalus]